MLTIRQTRQTLEKFVYAKGTNVALYNAEHSKPYQEMETELREALYSQIETVATLDNVSSCLRFTKLKEPNKELIDQITLILSANLVSNNINLAVYLYWAGEQGGQAALDKLGLSGVFNLKNKELLHYFDDHSRLILNSVDDYTKKWVAAKIQDGVDQGLGPSGIVDSLIKDGGEISKVRAERIVLTETASAMTRVELAASKRYGIETKVWHTSLDERTCHICLPLEEEEVGIDDLFPGELEGPPAHVRCRCFLEFPIPKSWETPEELWLGE